MAFVVVVKSMNPVLSAKNAWSYWIITVLSVYFGPYNTLITLNTNRIFSHSRLEKNLKKKMTRKISVIQRFRISVIWLYYYTTHVWSVVLDAFFPLCCTSFSTVLPCEMCLVRVSFSFLVIIPEPSRIYSCKCCIIAVEWMALNMWTGIVWLYVVVQRGIYTGIMHVNIVNGIFACVDSIYR